MEKVTVHQAKTHLSRLLRRVEAGEDIMICRGSVEVALLVAANAPARGVRETGMAGFEIEDAKANPKLAIRGCLKHLRTTRNSDEAIEPVWSDEDWNALLHGDLPSDETP